MSNTITGKLTQWVLWMIMAVSVVLFVIFFFGPVVEGTAGTRYQEPKITETFLVFTYLLFILAVGVTVVFSVISSIINPQGAKKGLYSALFIIGILVIAYILADDTVLHMPYYKGTDNVPGTLKMVDTGLFTAYILAALALLATLFSSISRVFK